MKPSLIFILLTSFGMGVDVVRSQEHRVSNPYTQAVVREVLAKGYPAADRKQVLELTRVPQLKKSFLSFQTAYVKF